MSDTLASPGLYFWFRSLRKRLSRRRGLMPYQGRLTAAAEVRASVHQDGLALLHLATGRVFVFNQTGARIWQGIVSGASPDTLSREISREYGVRPALVERDIAAFLRELERSELLTQSVDSSS